MYKRTLEEENSHVILLKLNPSFSVDNIAGLYWTFKFEENETALSQATKQLNIITDFVGDFEVNLVLGDNNYQHRRIYDEWLEAVTAFNIVQIVKEPT